MAALGRCTNAYCKVGDFSLPAGPLADEDRCDDILAHVVQCFGDNRLVYGSNWPVSGLQQGYGDVLTRLRATARRIGLDTERLEPAMTASALHLCDRSITANWSGI
jgi:L-fuconolactonase